MNGNGNVWDPTVPVEESPYYWRRTPVILEPASREPANDSGFTLVDLFSGMGGFSEGFSRDSSGQPLFATLLGLDIHRPSVQTFRRRHRDATTILGDIGQVPNELIRSLLVGRRVDVVTAGVPCQGFSLNNRKRWEKDPRNYLFREFIRVVRELHPPYIVLENVSGLSSTANGAFVEEISQAMADAGYSTVEHRILDAADYGVPQYRQRVFFIGARRGYRVLWPKPTHGDGLRPPMTVWEAIGDLPALDPGEESTVYACPPQTDYQRAMRDAPRLLNHRAPKHPRATVERIAATRPGEPMYESFRQRIRLHPDRPSPTQVSGGIRPQFSLGHPTQPRGLTVRERCRIQSFPDSYCVEGGIVQGRVQTGNAVPPLLARAVAECIAEGLRERGVAGDRPVAGAVGGGRNRASGLKPLTY